MTDYRKHQSIDERLLPDFSASLLAITEDATQEKEGDDPVLATALIRDAVTASASDVHLDGRGAGTAVRLRIDGRLRDAALLPEELGARVVAQLRTLAQLDPVGAFVPEEARRGVALEATELDLRLSAVPTVSGPKLSIRILDPRKVAPEIGRLGLASEAHERLEHWLHTQVGMLLATGPTGSGKTTTLYALLHAMGDAERCVITLEDPVEYRIDGVTQIQVDEAHGLTFTHGLRNVLRMDPDTILLGEIRDAESAAIAVRAAATGHSLLSTLHTRDAIGTVSALRSRGLDDHEIATSLAVVIGQRLVRTLCPDCKREDAPDDREVAWLRKLERAVPDASWHAVGCDACGGTGYRGRTGIFELWSPDAATLDAILAGADEHTLRGEAEAAGFRTLLDDALEKASRGQTSLTELCFVSGLG